MVEYCLFAKILNLVIEITTLCFRSRVMYETCIAVTWFWAKGELCFKEKCVHKVHMCFAELCDFKDILEIEY